MNCRPPTTTLGCRKPGNCGTDERTSAIEITELWVEATGRFHVARYLGLDSQQPPGYRHIDYTVHLRVHKASEGQIARLRQLCETSSPVGDTLTRPVPATLNLDVRAS